MLFACLFILKSIVKNSMSISNPWFPDLLFPQRGKEHDKLVMASKKIPLHMTEQQGCSCLPALTVNHTKRPIDYR